MIWEGWPHVGEVCVCMSVSLRACVWERKRVGGWLNGLYQRSQCVPPLVPLIDQQIALTRALKWMDTVLPHLPTPHPCRPSLCHQSCPTRCLTPGNGMGEWLCQPVERKPLLPLSFRQWKREEDNKVGDSSHSFPFSCTAASGESSVSPSSGTLPDISWLPQPFICIQR